MPADESDLDDVNSVPPKQDDPVRQAYVDDRRASTESEGEQSKLFDRSILTLSAGALALSLTFVEKIAPNPLPESVRMLLAAWIFFGGTILITLISFLVSQRAYQRQRDLNDARYESGQPYERDKFGDWVDRLNYSSIVSFMIGAFLLILFSFTNLERKSNMAKQGQDVTKGAKPSAPPKPPPPKKPTTTPTSSPKKGK